MDWLTEFGAAVERQERVAIDVGGEIVLGAAASGSSNPGKEEKDNGTAGSERPAGASAGDGPEAGPRPGRRAPSEAAARSPARALRELTEALRLRFGDWTGNGITEAEFEELATFFPDVRVSASSSRFAYLTLSATPFPTFGDRFRLVFELLHPRLVSDLTKRRLYFRRYEWDGRVSLKGKVDGFAFRSHTQPDELIDLVCAASKRSSQAFRIFPRLRPTSQLVPAVRAWARWDSGPLAGMRVISHHRQPDLSICACMPHQWVRGRDLLVDYVGMTVCWAAKVLYEQLLHRYPGQQHYPAWMRVERDRRREFCGCGGLQLYEDCHRAEDRAIPVGRLHEAEQESRVVYFDELGRERRPIRPPASVWDLPGDAPRESGIVG